MRKRRNEEEDERYLRNGYDPDDPDYEGDDEENDADEYDDREYEDDPDGEYENEGYDEDSYDSEEEYFGGPVKDSDEYDDEEFDEDDDGGPMMLVVKILAVLVAAAIVIFLGVFLWQRLGNREKEAEDEIVTDEEEDSELSVVDLNDLLNSGGTDAASDAENGETDAAGDAEQGEAPEPAAEPTKAPETVKTPEPTKAPDPTPAPTEKPTEKPTEAPTPAPTEKPTEAPTKAPEATAAPSDSAGTTDMKFTEVNDTVTAKDRTNLRDKPSQGDDSTVLYTLPNGETVKRTGVSDSGWSRLIYNDKTVYAVTTYLTTDLTAQPTATPAPADDGIKTKFDTRDEQVTPKNAVNLRKLPSVTNPDAEVVATIQKGTVITRTGINTDVGWSRVTYEGQTLYCVSSYIELVQ